jgi:hypothetical protein
MRSDGATRRIVIVDLGAAQDVKIVGAATAMPVAAKKRRRFIPELREESVIEILMTPDLNGRCEKKMAPGVCAIFAAPQKFHNQQTLAQREFRCCK